MIVYIVMVDDIHVDAFGDMHIHKSVIPCISQDVALREVQRKLRYDIVEFSHLFNNFNTDNLDKLSYIDTIKDGSVTSIGELNNRYALVCSGKHYNTIYQFKLWEKSNYRNMHYVIQILELEVRE